MAHHSRRRVVITGLGVVAPNGLGKGAFWHATQAGRPGIRPIQRFPTDNLPLRVAGEVNDFAVEDFVDRKLANRTDRMTHFAFAAIQEALSDARLVLEQEHPQRVGAVIANTQGGIEYALRQIVDTRPTRHECLYRHRMAPGG